MAEDIAPALLEKIRREFRQKYAASEKIQALLRQIGDGKASYVQAEDLAEQTGKLLSEVLQKYITAEALPDGRMYYNIASRVLRPMLEEDHGLIAQAAAAVQQALNERAGIGLKALAASLNNDRIEGFLNRLASEEDFSSVAWLLLEPLINYSMSVVDETLKANVDFQGKAGLRPKIIRRSERKCCKWCSALAGVYDYPDVPKDVYRRHEACRCTVDYDPGGGKRQNVWAKGWTDPEERAKIEARKQIGKEDFLSTLSKQPARLAKYTPESLKDELTQLGYTVNPLANGRLKGVPFSDGGGYKVNFADGGLLMYHPAKSSHHGGAYYKISTGKGGIHHYGINGQEFDPGKGETAP